MKKCMASLVLAVFLAIPGLARADTIMLALLLGENEVPPVNTPGYGFAVLYLPDDWSFLYYYVEFGELLSPARNAHLHAGPAESVGTVLFGLHGVPRARSGWFDGILFPGDFMPGGGLTTYEEALFAMMTGNVYLNVHSVGYSGGEIRGQTYVYEP